MIAINLTTGILATTQIPLDPKRYFKTIAEMQDLGAANYKAYYYYAGMVAICLENLKQYAWRERAVTDADDAGLLAVDFTYSATVGLVDGIDYTSKIYNFFPYAGEVTVNNINFIDIFNPNDPTPPDPNNPVFYGNKGFMLVVRDDETMLQLRPVAHVPLGAPWNCSVRKKVDGNYDILEVGDIVYWKEINEGGNITELIGYTYNGPDHTLLSSYSLNRTIAI